MTHDFYEMLKNCFLITNSKLGINICMEIYMTITYLTAKNYIIKWKHPRKPVFKTVFYYCLFLGRDFFCVQSMDGTLSFYEQESFAFSRFLPGSLLPGPLKYVTKTDSFITVSSSWHLESYK